MLCFHTVLVTQESYVTASFGLIIRQTRRVLIHINQVVSAVWHAHTDFVYRRYLRTLFSMLNDYNNDTNCIAYYILWSDVFFPWF